MQNKESEILVFSQRKTWEIIEFENYKGITCEKRKKILVFLHVYCRKISPFATFSL